MHDVYMHANFDAMLLCESFYKFNGGHCETYRGDFNSVKHG